MCPLDDDTQQLVEPRTFIRRLKRNLPTVDVTVGKLRFFGGYADIFEGSERGDAGAHGRKVAIKRIRFHLESISCKFAQVCLHAQESTIFQN